MASTATGQPPEAPAPRELTPELAAQTMGSRRYVALLIIVSVVGVIVSLATWVFLELIHQVTQELYTHLPNALGYTHGPPVWWPLPILAIAGVIVAFAIVRLPGKGGHVPANGLSTSRPFTPIELPGVVLAGLVGIGAGIVLGPEAPLMAIGPTLAVMAVTLIRRDSPPQVRQIVGAAGAFAAISFLFVNPLVAAVLIIEVTGIGGAMLPVIIIPGLLASGIGSLLAIGMGSWTGLNRSAIALGPIQNLPTFPHPGWGQFGWAIGVSIVIAAVVHVIVRGGRLTQRVVKGRVLVLLPIVGLIVAGLAIAFSQATGKSANEVLFSGESGLPTIVSQTGTWSVSAIGLLIVFKGLGYSISLGSFRGGPTFPAVFLGATGGLLASHLPGFPLTPAVAVGMGAATAAVLKLPISAIVLATLLTTSGGIGDEPLIIVGVVVAYLVTVVLDRRSSATAAESAAAAPSTSASPASAVARAAS